MNANLPLTSAPVASHDVTLSSLRRGEGGQIVRIDRPELEVALLKMGIAVGDQVIFSGAAPMRGPIAIRTHHTKLSLRREDANLIWINRRQ